MNRISRRNFLAASSALAGTMMLPRLGRAAEPKESASLQAKVDERRLAAGRRAPAGKSAGHHADRARRPAGRRLEPRAGRRRLAVDAGALPGLRAAGPLHAGLVGPDTQRRRELRGQSPRRPNIPSICARATSGRTASPSPPPTCSSGTTPISPTRRPASGSNSWWSCQRRAGQARGHRRADLQGHLPLAERLLRAAARLGPAGPDRAHAQALSREVPHPLQSGRRQAGQGAGPGELDRALPARDRLPGRQHVLPEPEPADAQRLDVRGRARTGHRAGASPSAIPTISRSTPRARSCPISTASSTRWSPIPRSCS